MSNMGTQYKFTLEDTNRDGAPVPDVFVVKDIGTASGEAGLTAHEFYEHLRRESADFRTVAEGRVSVSRESGYRLGKEAVYKEIVQWWNERDRNPNDTVAELIREWDLPTARLFTVTVSFEGMNESLIITGVEADDEEHAKQQVLDGVSASYQWDYTGPGDIDEDPFGDEVIYVDGAEAEEEDD